MATKKAPQVSIVLPTYNRARLLSRAIESIRNQTFTDWELILIDDASTDSTPAVISEYEKLDSRIKSLRNAQNRYPDISAILNQGIAMAAGTYIARLDDDDWWNDVNKLKEQVVFLQSHPDHIAVGTGTIVVDASDKELFRYLKHESDEQIRRSAFFANPFSHTSVLFRADAARGVGNYGAWRFAEDWDLWLRLGKIGKLHNLQTYSMTYLLNQQNKSFVHQRPQARMLLKLLRAHKGEYPRYYRGYAFHLLQYSYTFLPLSWRHKLHPFLSKIKRKVF